MDRKEIKNIMETLASSQGQYGRILRNIDSMSKEKQEVFWTQMEAMDIKDAVDLIMVVEG